ncbi:MAG: hypothetical protein GNW80_00815 [Asgard group archaeon]|nr:hypothetical protein [Asgard group archaeon]
MKNNIFRKLITLSFLVALVLPMFVLPAMSMPKDGDYGNNLTIEGADSYVEDFTSVTYRSGSTTALGWGTGAVLAPRNSSLELLDFFPTEFPAYGLAVQGRKAYVNCYDTGASYTLHAFDINNPFDIQRLSYRDSIDTAYTCEVDGDYLAIGTSDETINFYNVQDPTALNGAGIFLDWFDVDGAVTDIDIDGHLYYYTIYNSTSGKSLGVAYADDPGAPLNIICDWANDKALGLDVEGTTGYIAASDDGFYVMDFQDKYNPVEYGWVDTPGNATDVIVEGAFAYVADGEAGIQIINVVDPTNPTIIGSYNTGGYARRLVKQGNTLLVADGSSITVLDVADPTHPLGVAAIGPHTDLYDVDLYGGIIVAVDQDGIYTYRYSPNWGIPDISTTVFPNPFDQFQVWDVRVVGRIAYIAGGPDGFYTLDVRDPANPILLDNYALPAGPALRVDVDNNIAHVTTDTANYVLDVSNPSDILLLDEMTGAFDMIDICVQGNIMFATMGTNLGIANFTNPLNPIVIINYAVPGATNLTAVWAQGRKLYLANNFGGSGNNLIILDITDLFVPVVHDVHSLSSYGEDICVDGDLAYMADSDWLVPYNVSDPTNIVYIDSAWIDGDFPDSYGVSNFGPYVLNAGGADGVLMINETDFTAETATRYLNATSAMKITTSGDFTYVANMSNLIILRHFLSPGATFHPGVSIAESTEVDIINGNKIISATLTVNQFTPPRTQIDYYLSADGGLNWEAVTPGIAHVFINKGDDLRWRAEIIGPEDTSAHLYGLTINFEYSALSPMMLYIIIGAGGGLLLIILIVIIVIAVRRKKKTPTR